MLLKTISENEAGHESKTNHSECSTTYIWPMYETDMYVKLYETQKYGKYKRYLHLHCLTMLQFHKK